MTTLRTVRFRVHRGNLEPIEPVPLVEGTEFEVDVPIAAQPSTAASVLAVMQRLPDIDPSIVDEFEQTIRSATLPVRSDGVFDEATR